MLDQNPKLRLVVVLSRMEMVFVILDDLEMSEMLKSYFGSVFTKENLSDKLPEVEQVFKGDLSSNLTDIIMTPEVVVEKLNKLKSSKAPGLVSDFFSENI